MQARAYVCARKYYNMSVTFLPSGKTDFSNELLLR